MGIYRRPDSKDWWMAIERRGQRPQRMTTGICVDGGSPAGDKAQRAAAQQVYALAKAQHVLGQVSPGKPVISFADFSAWYLTNVALHRRSATTERSMLTRIAIHFNRFDSLAAIDAHAVEEWKTARRREKKAPATVNRELDVLKAMLNKAVPKYLDRSPLGSVRRFRVPEAEPRTLTIDEEDRLLAVATDEERAWLTLAIDTLLRLSNVVHLKWAQVKMGPRVIVPLTLVSPIFCRIEFQSV